MANLSSKTGTVTTPVQTQLALSNNSTSSVQDLSAYEAQDLSGLIYINATTSYRASFSVSVVKNGAGTYEIAAVNIQGDDVSGSPIASFSMSGSILQVTIGSFAGFNSSNSYIRYQLSAPYLGGNYPLSIDGSQILSGTIPSARLPAGQYPGSTSGSAIPAGCIGYTINGRQTISVPASQYTANSGITLTKGTWLITGSVTIDFTTSVSVSDFLFIISPNNTAGDGTWRQSSYNDSWINGITATRIASNLVAQYVRYDGTNLYRFEDNTWKDATASATGSIYLKVYKGNSGTHTAYTQLTAQLIS